MAAPEETEKKDGDKKEGDETDAKSGSKVEDAEDKDKSPPPVDDEDSEAKIEIENAKTALAQFKLLETLFDEHLKERFDTNRSIRERFVPSAKSSTPNDTVTTTSPPIVTPPSPLLTEIPPPDLPPPEKAAAPALANSKKPATITFASIWLLYDCGDIVYTEDQAFRIVHVAGARPLNKEKAVNYREKKTFDEEGQPKYRSYETFSPLEVHCYHYSFDGDQYGVVKKVFWIPMYPGERSVASLPLWPASVAGEMGLKKKLVERGRLFIELAKDGQDFVSL